jgi:hypothetical protein
MTITTVRGGWVVIAEWYGTERIVFGGKGTPIWECIDWKAENE